MKRMIVSLIVITFALIACGNFFAKIIPVSNETKEVVEITKTIEETTLVNQQVNDSQVVNTEINKTKNEETKIEETEFEENKTNEKERVSDEVEDSQNEFFKMLDALKNVHPGTAGSSLKVASAAYKFLNNCRVRLPFDIMAGEWVKKQDKADFADINESFQFVYESVDQFKDLSKIKGLLSDVGIELPDDATFDGIIDEAKKVLKVVIDATK